MRNSMLLLNLIGSPTMLRLDPCGYPLVENLKKSKEGNKRMGSEGRKKKRIRN
jgi:hypothetical protein